MDTLSFGIEINNQEWVLDGIEPSGSYSADIVIGDVTFIGGSLVNDVQTSADGTHYSTVVSDRVAKINLSPFAKKTEVEDVLRYSAQSLTSQQKAQARANIGAVDTELAQSLTWAELKTLRDGSNLIPGKMYRITDYVATTTQEETRSANHPFDIIVTAISANALSEEAMAAVHAGDTYFANSQLSAWRLGYILDNDDSRYEWADTTNGKGVIYRLRDEFENECPYDFKGIQFARHEISAVSRTSISALVGIPVASSIGHRSLTVDTAVTKWYYTFSQIGSAWTDEVTDASLDNTTTTVVFTEKTAWTTNTKQSAPSLLDNVFVYGPAVNTLCIALDPEVQPVTADKTYFEDLYFDGADCKHNTFVGVPCLSKTEGTFRKNIIVGAFRHIYAQTNFENNTIIAPYDLCFINFGHCFSENFIFAHAITYTNFDTYFLDNQLDGAGAKINNSTFGRYVTRCQFNGLDLGSVTINGQLTDCTFTGKFTACTFNAICSYVDFVGGASGNTCTGLDVVGGIRGASDARVNVENSSDFIYPNASGTKRRIRLEGDTNGDMVISWYSNGSLIRKTKGASGSTWTSLTSL